MYVGVDIGQEKQEFHPRYEFASGAPTQRYADNSTGRSYALRIGHAWSMAERVTLAAQLRYAHADNRWRLATPEPATLDYQIPDVLSLGLVARYVVSGPWSAHAELSIGRGDVQLRKQSGGASVTQYARDGAANQQGWAIGAGYALSPALGLQAEYRRLRFESLGTTSTLPGSSTVVETLTDRPTTEGLVLGLQYRW
ncbi:MAG: hypothetical protein RL026_1427 [Pseudomonadota bacterium]